jgi:hypothetical protein
MPKKSRLIFTGVAACGVLLGCSVSQDAKPRKLSSEVVRILYPRQYLDSVDPIDRKVVERDLESQAADREHR